MANTRTCIVAAVLIVAVQSTSGARLRRSEYLFDAIQDASVAGDYIVGLDADCSDDDDSSESLELGYVIINKREAPEDERGRSSRDQPASSAASAQPLPNIKTVTFV